MEPGQGFQGTPRANWALSSLQKTTQGNISLHRKAIDGVGTGVKPGPQANMGSKLAALRRY